MRSRELLISLALVAGCSSRSMPASNDENGVSAAKGGYDLKEPEYQAVPTEAPAAPPAIAADAAPSPLQIIHGASPVHLSFQAGEEAGKAPPAAEAPALRQWFPESFVWQPLVQTDDHGTASVDIRVPDQLTTWRILALAHTREGAQAGAVKTFDGTLPVYVDPVVPGWLFAGDQVSLPVQVVNTTQDALSAKLVVHASGALKGDGQTTVIVPGGASDVQAVLLTTNGAGAAKLRADLAGADAAERDLPVLPAGRPIAQSRGGTVSDTRTFHLDDPADVDPATQQATVLVFPGPLAVLQAETERSAGGTTPWQAAYGFALATHLQQLSAATKVDVDEKTVRKLELTSWQRVVRLAQAPDPGTAADLLVAMNGVVGHALAEETVGRLASTVAHGQRGDGTWARQDGAPLQEVLVQTAYAGRTLGDGKDVVGAKIRAQGAIERNLPAIVDPYTAAVVLASGLVDGDSEKALLDIVTKGIVTEPDGRHTVAVPADVLNTWGQRPSQAEDLAWTSLALAKATDLNWRGDLVAELMGGYDATWGFGAGPADAIALDAVTRGLPGLDKPVDVVLSVDGVEVDRQKLDPTQPKAPATLVGKPAGKDVAYTLTVDPPVPGLAFVATLHSWAPWSTAKPLPGVDAVARATSMAVGRDATITLSLAAPSGTSLTIEQGLPAGATVDEEAFAALGDRVVSHRITTDRVIVTTRPFQAGEAMELPIVVRPAFAGRFTTSPLTVADAATPTEKATLAPLTWAVSVR